MNEKSQASSQRIFEFRVGAPAIDVGEIAEPERFVAGIGSAVLAKPPFRRLVVQNAIKEDIGAIFRAGVAVGGRARERRRSRRQVVGDDRVMLVMADQEVDHRLGRAAPCGDPGFIGDAAEGFGSIEDVVGNQCGDTKRRLPGERLDQAPVGGNEPAGCRNRAVDAFQDRTVGKPRRKQVCGEKARQAVDCSLGRCIGVVDEFPTPIEPVAETVQGLIGSRSKRARRRGSTRSISS